MIVDVGICLVLVLYMLSPEQLDKQHKYDSNCC